MRTQDRYFVPVGDPEADVLPELQEEPISSVVARWATGEFFRLDEPAGALPRHRLLFLEPGVCVYLPVSQVDELLRQESEHAMNGASQALSLGNTADADAFLSHAIRAAPNDPLPRLALARLLRQGGEEEAIALGWLLERLRRIPESAQRARLDETRDKRVLYPVWRLAAEELSADGRQLFYEPRGERPPISRPPAAPILIDTQLRRGQPGPSRKAV